MRTTHKLFLGLALFVLLLCGRSIARAQDANLLVLGDQEIQYPLGLHLETLEDPQGALTIEQVTQPEVSARFTPNSQATPNFGVTNSAYWIRFQVRNETSLDAWRLAFSNARMGLIDLYVPTSNGSGWGHQQAGTYLPASVRTYAHPHFLFPVSLPPSGDATIYLRLQSNLPMRFSLLLWPADLFEQYNHAFFGFIGIFYGIVGIMELYNLLLFVFMRRITYLYYFFFIAFYTLNTATSDGTALLYLYPHLSFRYAVYGFGTLAVVFLTLLIRDFLELKLRLPWLNRVLVTLAVIQFVSFGFYIFYPQAFALGSLIVMLFSILAILGSILVWQQGVPSARYFLLAWIGVLLNAILLNSTNIRLIAGYPLHDIGQYISTLLLVVLLSLALADQINVLRTKTIKAEVAKRISEEHFRHLYERAPLGIAIADSDGNIEQANRAMLDLLGYNEKEILKLRFLDLVYKDDHNIAKQNFQRLSQGVQASITGEIQYRHKNGNPIWVMRSVSALWDDKGDVRHTFAIINNINERKKQEAELRLYNENLEELVAGRTRELERSREQLIILNRSSQMVNAAGLDIEQAYVTIRAASAWLVPAEVFALSLVDQAAGLCEDVFLADGDQRIPGSSHPLEGSFIEQILAEGISLKVDDFQSNPQIHWGSGLFGKHNGVRSGIAVLLRGKKDVLGVLTVQSYQPHAYQDTDQSILESFSAHVATTLENIQLYQQAEKSAVLEERQRLARELHDSVTQLLYSMALMSGGWATKARQGQLPDPAEGFGQIEELSLQALKEMRLLIHQLSPTILGKVGLLQALQNRLDAVEQRVHVDAQLCVNGNFPTISPIVEEEIYFITLEALNNALRHSHATSTQVVMQADQKQLLISVEDNGRGYDPAQQSNGMGTTTMRTRARAIGARIQTESHPGKGTKVVLTVKLESDERESA